MLQYNIKTMYVVGETRRNLVMVGVVIFCCWK